MSLAAIGVSENIVMYKNYDKDHINVSKWYLYKATVESIMSLCNIRLMCKEHAKSFPNAKSLHKL
mgnify:FL=1